MVKWAKPLAEPAGTLKFGHVPEGPFHEAPFAGGICWSPSSWLD